MRWLIFGGTGWIGGMLVRLLSDNEENEVIISKSRLEHPADVCSELDDHKPDRVINAAGLTGTPNIDWLEDHQVEGLRVNVTGTLFLLDACFTRGIHVTQLATGCIYEYDETHVPGPHGIPFTETDVPNFEKSYYSKTKKMLELLAEPLLTNTLWLRIRMPLTPNSHPRNFITKIRKYKKVVNIQNSMTVLTEMCPVVLLLATHKEVGIYNFTNPGTISHNEVLSLYRDTVDPSFTWENFSVEEQSLILKAGRSNNALDSSKLMETVRRLDQRLLPKPIGEAVLNLFKTYHATS